MRRKVMKDRFRSPFAARLTACVLAVLFILGSAGCSTQTQVLMTAGTETVTVPEAKLFLYLTLEAYEEKAGENVWKLRIDGESALEAACRSALSSMQRSRTVLLHLSAGQKTLTQEEEGLVREAADNVYTRLGAETCARFGLERAAVEKIMKEEYWVSKFVSQMAYLPDMGEVDRRVEERFVWYDHLDISEYMQRVRLEGIFIYAGQWLGEEWVSYSGNVLEDSRARAEEALQAVAGGEPIVKAAEKYSEVTDLSQAPPFQEGLIRCRMYHQYYAGQMERNLWESIYRLPAGSLSGILESKYGYLIVQVGSFPQLFGNDTERYQTMLAELKEEYRAGLMEEQTGRGIEKTILEWQNDLSFKTEYALWQTVTEEVADAYFAGKNG